MKFFFSVLFVALFVAQSLAQTPLERFLNSNAIGNSNVSLLVRNMDTGEVVSSHNAATSLIPASTMKVVTSAVAFEMLGADYRFQTRIQIDGTVDENGVLHGNLIIFGGGDPTLGSARVPPAQRYFLSRWSREIRNAGIRSITGSVIGDASLFDSQGINSRWIWENISTFFAAGAYGISYLDNAARVHFNSGAVGTTPTITRVVPDIPGLNFTNNLRSTTIGRDSAAIYGAPLSMERTIYGEVPANRPNVVARMDIPDPALLLAQHLHNRLTTDGVSINGEPKGIYFPMENSDTRKTIFTHYSMPLSWINQEINFRSNNHYSEVVFRYLALQRQQQATTQGAINVINSHLRQRGIDTRYFFMFDGSGLSRGNGMSAEFLVDLLTYMKQESPVGSEFFESLPVGGQSGTIASLFSNQTLNGRVHAKSGSLTRVRAYAGYIMLEDRNYVFAVIVNNFAARPNLVVREIDNFLTNIARETQD